METWRGRGLDPVIAERRLYIDGEEKVRVRIGAPSMSEDEPYESGCPFQIEGIGSGKVRFVFGEDRVQALFLALQTIGADLYSSEEFKAGRLRPFPDSPPHDDLGFPIIPGLEELFPQRNVERSTKP